MQYPGCLVISWQPAASCVMRGCVVAGYAAFVKLIMLHALLRASPCLLVDVLMTMQVICCSQLNHLTVCSWGVLLPPPQLPSHLL
jgi:hypothetical protein